MVGRADEQDTASSDYGASVVFAAGVAQAPRGQLWKLAKRNLPDDFAPVEVNRIQRSPRRLHGGIAVGVKELVVPVVLELEVHGRGGRNVDLLIVP